MIVRAEDARDADGYLTYVGRSDDVFKASRSGDIPFRMGLSD
ncbi:acetyl-CoA synthetase [Streptomyces sp. MnatMP-M17]|nr:acetyl-CoA synthetase [Streptomyces sp. MnatMP-M17]